jgi:hypothetical protein
MAGRIPEELLRSKILPPPGAPSKANHGRNGNPAAPDQTADESWLDSLTKAVRTSPELQALEIEPRPRIHGEWLKEGDLGFIFAARGVGKT